MSLTFFPVPWIQQRALTDQLAIHSPSINMQVLRLDLCCYNKNCKKVLEAKAMIPLLNDLTGRFCPALLMLCCILPGCAAGSKDA